MIKHQYTCTGSHSYKLTAYDAAVLFPLKSVEYFLPVRPAHTMIDSSTTSRASSATVKLKNTHVLLRPPAAPPDVTLCADASICGTRTFQSATLCANMLVVRLNDVADRLAATTCR